MKKLVVAAVCTVSLSGCAMPVGVTVATWAADGWSMLTTKKSILDHGISYVSGEDCALWRMFSDEDICKPEDGETMVVDAGAAQGFAGGYSEDALADYRTVTETEVDVAGDDQPEQPAGGRVVIAALGDSQGYTSNVGKPWYRQNKNAEYLSLMPESFSRGARPAAEPVVMTAASVPAVPVAPVRTTEPPADLVVASGQAPAPAIDIDFEGSASSVPATPVIAAQADVVRPTVSSGTGFSAAPGQYFVVGSFSVPENADRFASSLRHLAAHVQQASVNGGDVYRVVVGPYLDEEKVDISNAIADAGISSTWRLHVGEGSSVAAWLPYDAEEVASIAVAPQS